MSILAKRDMVWSLSTLKYLPNLPVAAESATVGATTAGLAAVS